MRLLARHPQVEIRLLTADRQAGKPLAEVFPQFGHLKLPTLVKIEEADWSGIDLAFCCLPHGTTQEVIAKLPRHLKIVDISADFRLPTSRPMRSGTAMSTARPTCRRRRSTA